MFRLNRKLSNGSVLNLAYAEKRVAESVYFTDGSLRPVAAQELWEESTGNLLFTSAEPRKDYDAQCNT